MLPCLSFIFNDYFVQIFSDLNEAYVVNNQSLGNKKLILGDRINSEN
jgi:hypothetical protein